jgi:hypothetical protein
MSDSGTVLRVLFPLGITAISLFFAGPLIISIYGASQQGMMATARSQASIALPLLLMAIFGVIMASREVSQNVE